MYYTVAFARGDTLPQIVNTGGRPLADSEWDTSQPELILARSGIFSSQARFFQVTDGGMSKVYCFDVEDQSYVLKFSKMGKKFNHMFTQEVDNQYLASTLTQTPEIFYARSGEAQSAIIMSYVRGPTLHEYEEDENMPSVLQQLALDLYRIHAMDITHRDIKPTNVVVTEDGPALIDFGISIRHKGVYTETSNILQGTLPFMAPESVLHSEYSERSDQFSFGALACQLLTEDIPLVDDKITFRTLTKRHKTHTSRIDRELLDAYGHAEELAEVVDRCLSKDPVDRFPNMLEVGKALEKYA